MTQLRRIIATENIFMMKFGVAQGVEKDWNLVEVERVVVEFCVFSGSLLLRLGSILIALYLDHPSSH